MGLGVESKLGDSIVTTRLDHAIKCYNKTDDHLLAVSKLTTVEEVAAYDYKEGYPDNLVFKVD